MAERPGAAEIFRRAGPAYRRARAGRLDAGRLRVMGAIESCRTAALGGRLFQCGSCGRQHPIQNSCRDRHCPNCQGAAARKWMKRRTGEILPVPYFHLVFTMPKEIAGIGLRNRRLLIAILFRAAHETVRTIAADPRRGGRRIGGTSVLHTWDQQLRFHPHLHLVVPNAGIDVETGKWTVGSDRFLAPVKVLASLFRRRFLEQLARAGAEGRVNFAGGIGHPARPEAFRDAVAAAGLGRLRQTAVPRTGAGLRLPVALHPLTRMFRLVG